MLEEQLELVDRVPTNNRMGMRTEPQEIRTKKQENEKERKRRERLPNKRLEPLNKRGKNGKLRFLPRKDKMGKGLL